MPAERVIGVDLGGTKILAGVVSRDGEIGRRMEVATPMASQEEILLAVDLAVTELIADDVAALGVGVPLRVDPSTGILLDAVNIPLGRVDLAGRLRARFGTPVGVENDGNAAALAEWKLGAGRDSSDLAVLTLGTGVGGGLVLAGALYRGWAELGHVVVLAGGPPCQGGCHGRGHLEGLVSGTAADRAARHLFGDSADARSLVELARSGDERATSELTIMGGYLGAAIGSFANVFGLSLAVVGGGFGAAAAEFLLGPAVAAARREAMEPLDEGLEVVGAALGRDAGLVGAALAGFAALDGER